MKLLAGSLGTALKFPPFSPQSAIAFNPEVEGTGWQQPAHKLKRANYALLKLDACCLVTCELPGEHRHCINDSSGSEVVWDVTVFVSLNS